MKLKIWPLDRIHCKRCKGYLIHIPFGTAFFLWSDVPHGGCYRCEGNIHFHCAFQCEDNVGDDRDLLYMDCDIKKTTEYGDQNCFIYSYCDANIVNPDISIPVVNDREVLYMQQKYYLVSWDAYAY